MVTCWDRLECKLCMIGIVQWHKMYTMRERGLRARVPVTLVHDGLSLIGIWSRFSRTDRMTARESHPTIAYA